MITCRIPVPNDLEQMIELVMTQYAAERKAVLFLPEPETMRPLFTRAVSRLIEKGTGLVALEDDQIVGYMIGVKHGLCLAGIPASSSPCTGTPALMKQEKLKSMLLFMSRTPVAGYVKAWSPMPSSSSHTMTDRYPTGLKTGSENGASMLCAW